MTDSIAITQNNNPVSTEEDFVTKNPFNGTTENQLEDFATATSNQKVETSNQDIDKNDLIDKIDKNSNLSKVVEFVSPCKPQDNAVGELDLGSGTIADITPPKVSPGTSDLILPDTLQNLNFSEQKKSTLSHQFDFQKQEVIKSQEGEGIKNTKLDSDYGSEKHSSKGEIFNNSVLNDCMNESVITTYNNITQTEIVQNNQNTQSELIQSEIVNNVSQIVPVSLEKEKPATFEGEGDKNVVGDKSENDYHVYASGDKTSAYMEQQSAAQATESIKANEFNKELDYSSLNPNVEESGEKKQEILEKLNSDEDEAKEQNQTNVKHDWPQVNEEKTNIEQSQILSYSQKFKETTPTENEIKNNGLIMTSEFDEMMMKQGQKEIGAPNSQSFKPQLPPLDTLIGNPIQNFNQNGYDIGPSGYKGHSPVTNRNKAASQSHSQSNYQSNQQQNFNAQQQNTASNPQTFGQMTQPQQPVQKPAPTSFVPQVFQNQNQSVPAIQQQQQQFVAQQNYLQPQYQQNQNQPGSYLNPPGVWGGRDLNQQPQSAPQQPVVGGGFQQQQQGPPINRFNPGPQQNKFIPHNQQQNHQQQNQILPPQLAQQMQRDNHFKEQIFGETLHINRQLVASLQETNQSTLKAIQMISGMMAPLLEQKDKENKRLKRLLSQRYGINNDEDITLAELGANVVGQHTRNMGIGGSKRQKKDDSFESEDQDNAQSDNSQNNVNERKFKNTFQPKQGKKTFSPQKQEFQMKPQTYVEPVKEVEKPVNLNFKRKKAEPEPPAYTLKPSQKPFNCPISKPGGSSKIDLSKFNIPDEDLAKDKPDEPMEQTTVTESEDAGFGGFMMGGSKGKKFNFKMDLSKAQQLMGQFNPEDEDGEALLESIKANEKKGNIKSFDDIAAQEDEIAQKRQLDMDDANAKRLGEQPGLKDDNHHNPESNIQDKIQIDKPQPTLVLRVEQDSNHLQNVFQSHEELSCKQNEKLVKYVDREILNALAGISTQDTYNGEDESEEDEEDSAEHASLMEQLKELQECLQKVQKVNNYIYDTVPIAQTLDDRKRKYFQKFEKIITIETTDPILNGICNIDRYNNLDGTIQMIQLDRNQAIMKAKLKGDYPVSTDLNKPCFGVMNIERAMFWKSRCLCEINKKKLILENRNSESIVINCKICDNLKNIGPEQIHKILKDNLSSRVTTNDFDKYWTINMYGQVVWKLACYNQFFGVQSLSLFNILHNLAQKLIKEFIDVKKSFFQKSIIKEIPAGAHVVLLIANIRKSLNATNKKSYLMDLSDGSYIMTAFINENEKRFQCDQELISLIDNGQIQIGEKYHFFGLYLNNSEMFGKDKMARVNTDHYYLQNKHQCYLKININGFRKAHEDEKIGEQPYPFFRIPLNSVCQYSKQICCTDVFIIKRTAQYFLEELQQGSDQKTNQNTGDQPPEKQWERKKRILRSRKAMERIRFLRQETIEGKLSKDYENMFFRFQMSKNQNSAALEAETDCLREKMSLIKEEQLDCFKLCFRVKCVDSVYWEQLVKKQQEFKQKINDNQLDFSSTLEYKDEIERIKDDIDKNRTYIITFIKSSPELYDSIRDGQRVRFYNLKPDGTVAFQNPFKGSEDLKNEQALFLQFQNGRSKMENIADKIREKQGNFVMPKARKMLEDMKNFGLTIVIQPVKPIKYLQRMVTLTARKNEEQAQNFKKCNEMTFIGYIVRILYQPNPEGANHPETVNQVILLSAQGDIICVQIHDPHFFIKNAFPNENQRAVFDHLAFTKMTRVNIKTRDNDLIEDTKLSEHLKDYVTSVNYLDIDKEDQNIQRELELPDNFYYLMCRTNNNTQIETESNRHYTEFKQDCIEMNDFVNSRRFQLRMRQIQMIIGEKKTVDKAQFETASETPQFRTFGKPSGNSENTFMGYNTFLCKNSQTDQPAKKDLVINAGGIENKYSPNKEENLNLRSAINFNFKSKTARERQGFQELIKKKAQNYKPNSSKIKPSQDSNNMNAPPKIMEPEPFKSSFQSPNMVMENQEDASDEDIAEYEEDNNILKSKTVPIQPPMKKNPIDEIMDEEKVKQQESDDDDVDEVEEKSLKSSFDNISENISPAKQENEVNKFQLNKSIKNSDKKNPAKLKVDKQKLSQRLSQKTEGKVYNFSIQSSKSLEEKFQQLQKYVLSPQVAKGVKSGTAEQNSSSLKSPLNKAEILQGEIKQSTIEQLSSIKIQEISMNETPLETIAGQSATVDQEMAELENELHPSTHNQIDDDILSRDIQKLAEQSIVLKVPPNSEMFADTFAGYDQISSNMPYQQSIKTHKTESRSATVTANDQTVTETERFSSEPSKNNNNK